MTVIPGWLSEAAEAIVNGVDEGTINIDDEMHLDPDECFALLEGFTECSNAETGYCT